MHLCNNEAELHNRRMDIANRLDMAMRAAKVPDHAELSRLAGVSIYKINRVLSGRTRTMDAEDAYKLALACGVPVAWLIAGEDERGEPVQHAVIYQTEAELIELFRSADAQGRAAILLAAKLAAEKPDDQSKK